MILYLCRRLGYDKEKSLVKGAAAMRSARFITNIVLAASAGITALLFIASLVLSCIDMD